MVKPENKHARTSTGIRGLDSILNGGLPEGRVFLVQGGPGTGKTTTSFHFLRAGAATGERVLYVSLLQTRDEISDILKSHGWSLDGIDMLELPENLQEIATSEQTVFSPADVELDEVTDSIIKAVEEYKPQRLVLDSVSELSVLVDSFYQLRRQLLKLKRALGRHKCTSILTAGETRERDNRSIQTIVHGVIMLEQRAPAYGPPRRRLQVTKMRGMEYVGGYHDFRIRTGGLYVYPRVRMLTEPPKRKPQKIASGNEEIDALLGGGLEEGTSCLIVGTTGSGKSTLSSLYVEAAAQRKDGSMVLCFDEHKQTFLNRSRGLGMKMPQYIDQGLVDLRQMNIGECSPGQFVEIIREAVEQKDIRVVVIDSLTGFLAAMAEEQQIIPQLHELLNYLSGAGVLTLMVVATHGVFGASETEIDASYLADTVILMRHFEAMGKMRRCISVLKKRHGKHETTIREVEIAIGGVRLGQPLSDFTGVLTGTPRYEGAGEKLLNEREK
jgi:circadian clock protein KaiC